MKGVPQNGIFLKTLVCLFCVSSLLPAQSAALQATPAPRAAAPIDLTGYWVSVVTEDWKFRMVTPPKGNYSGVPLNAEGRKVADTWDPAKDEASGNQCRSYGAAGLMRVPGRLHITWDNDTTMKVEADAGTQTRVFHFGGTVPQGTEPSWQGYSIAGWEYAAGGAKGAKRRVSRCPRSRDTSRSGILGSSDSSREDRPRTRR